MPFGFKSKKARREEDLRNRAGHLLIDADLARGLANKTDSIDMFIEEYEEMLECFRQICEIAQQVSIVGMLKGNPQQEARGVVGPYQGAKPRDILVNEKGFGKASPQV